MADPDRAFRALLGIAALAVFVLFGGVVRLLLAAGAPVGTAPNGMDFWCLLVPTEKDLGTHILSYLFLAAVSLGSLVGISSVIAQVRKTRRLTTDLQPHVEGQSWSEVARAATRLGLSSQVILTRSNDPRAFCYGLMHPRICVTTALTECLNQPELEAVLLHEKYHLEKRDPLKVAVGKVVVTSLFFLPIVKSFYAKYLFAKELAADEEVVRKQGQRRNLASALAKLITLKGTATADLMRESGGVGLINHRIDSLLGEKPTSWGRPSSSAIAASFFVLALGILSLVAPIEALRGLALFGIGGQGQCHLT